MRAYSVFVQLLTYVQRIGVNIFRRSVGDETKERQDAEVLVEGYSLFFDKVNTEFLVSGCLTNRCLLCL